MLSKKPLNQDIKSCTIPPRQRRQDLFGFLQHLVWHGDRVVGYLVRPSLGVVKQCPDPAPYPSLAMQCLQPASELSNCHLVAPDTVSKAQGGDLLLTWYLNSRCIFFITQRPRGPLGSEGRTLASGCLVGGLVALPELSRSPLPLRTRRKGCPLSGLPSLPNGAPSNLPVLSASRGV